MDLRPIPDFYYDFDLDHKFTAEDLEAIEAEMKKVIKENQRFERFEKTREEAIELIKEIGQEAYKLGRLDDIPEGDTISFYRNGEFVDLCAGTHVNYTKKIKAYKLLNVAGAYHRGDEKNKQLQRIYGTAFATKDELQQYLDRLEEARKRDHRKIGKDMELFHIDEHVGQGLVLWTAKGSIIRNELQNFISEELRKQGYDQVYTPHIGKLDLYKNLRAFPLLPGLAVSARHRPPVTGRPSGRKQELFRPVQPARGGKYRRLPAEADELPHAHQALRLAASLLPRPSGALRRIRHGLPLGTIGRIERHDARARVYPG